MSPEQEERDFSELEIDALGEISNISMGSAATAVSTLLDRKVDITIPKVSVVKIKDINLGDLEPALGVEISYIKGISGTNVMVLNKQDINTIVNIMTGGMLGNDPEAEIDEMSVSAICEIMNQMMGSSATALSNFLNRMIDISPPRPVEADNPLETLKTGHAKGEDSKVVLIRFNLDIEDAVHSQFFSIMTYDLAEELVKTLLGESGELMAEPEPVPEPPAATPSENSGSSGGTLTQEEIEALLNSSNHAEPEPDPEPAPVQSTPTVQAQPRVVARTPTAPQATSQAQPVELQSFDEKLVFYKEEQPGNLELIRSVPLEISVEIGRSTKKIKEILELTQGSVVELDKQAGAQVDVMVNGQLIAKGDVVVIGDNFGVRITEIAKRDELLKLQ